MAKCKRCDRCGKDPHVKEITFCAGYKNVFYTQYQVTCGCRREVGDILPNHMKAEAEASAVGFWNEEVRHGK